jgi:multicomponent Na+:H+ antiporter subunit E
MGHDGSNDKAAKTPFWSLGLVSLWAVLFVVWMITNSTMTIEVAMLGTFITLPISWVFASSSDTWTRVRWAPKGILHFLLYSGTFFVELVKANINMMRYIYALRIDIKPGIIKVRTRLQSPIGRLALANTIALTPGSLVMELRGDMLFIHLLDIDGIDADAATDAIVTPFERHLEHVFG